MRFLIDLIRWFFTGSKPQPSQNDTEIPAVSVQTIQPEPVVKKQAATFDLAREADPNAFMTELKSIKSFADQFESARQDLVQELQRLAPRKRNTRKDAA